MQPKTMTVPAYNGSNGVLFAPADYNAARVLGSVSYGGNSQGATAIGSYTITPGGLYSDQLGYDISFISGVLNINGYWLTLAISGSGSVNSSNGSGLGYACNTATCSAVPFGSGDTVTLTATGSKLNLQQLERGLQRQRKQSGQHHHDRKQGGDCHIQP